MKQIYLKLSTVIIVALCALSVFAKVDDVGIVGNGEVTLFYKDGDKIVMKKCISYTVLKTPADCILKEGTSEVKKSIESFRAQIIDMLEFLATAPELTPSMQEKVKFFTLVNSQGLTEKLQKVMDFIKAYGIENADKNFLKKIDSLSSNPTIDHNIIASNVKEISDTVERVITEISSNGLATSRIYKKKVNSIDELVRAILQYASYHPCGLSGSIEERIKDCSSQKDSNRGDLVLVTKINDIRKIYKQNALGLLWSERMEESMDHEKAKNACKQYPSLGKIVASGSWRLPNTEDYLVLAWEGGKELLQNTVDSATFWTAKSDYLHNENYPDYFEINNANPNGRYDYSHKSEKHRVHCVATP